MGRIMILANSSGGLYDFRNEVVMALLEKGEVIVCVPDETATQKLREQGCRVEMTPINRRGMNPLQDMGLYRQYRKLLKQYKPDVVLTYTVKPNIYGGFACRCAHIPYITNITGLGTTFERGGMVQKLVTTMYRIALKKADCVFFQNAYNKEVLSNLHVRGKKERLVPGSGVNLQKHNSEPYPTGEQIEFLFVGRIMKEKGIEEYLEAATRFHEEHVKFGILGYCEEAYEERMKQLSQDGIITFYGFDTQVHQYLTRASAIVVPSYHEGMSNVVLEASATARPVLATKIHGCMEGIEDGVTGLLFEPRNAQALCEKIEQFLQFTAQERAQMGQAARNLMEQKFGRQLVVAAYIEEIEKTQERK